MSQTSGIHDFWLATGWACGMVRMDGRTGRVIRGGAPIFDRLVGQILLHVVMDGGYKMLPLSPVRVERQRRLPW